MKKWFREYRQKRILMRLLSNARFEWRSMKSMCNAINEDQPTTQRLLIEIGARASTTDNNVWSLRA